jgi:hypothetical protein
LELRDEHGTNGPLGAFWEHKELRAWKKEGHFHFFAHRGDFHGRMAVRGNAALGRAGILFIGPLSLALRARLIFTRPLLVEIVQNILGTHPQCVCCFPSNIIIKLPFSEVHPFTIVVLFLLGDLPDFINLFYI